MFGSNFRRTAMRHVLAVTFAAATSATYLAAPADAGFVPNHFSKETLCKVVYPCVPPARYRSGAFLAPPKVVSVSMAQIQRICANETMAMGEVPTVMGCAELTGTQCIVHVSDSLKQIDGLYDVVLQHELGHCRGWVHG